MNLNQLARVILHIENDGISKVRFAKTIYFVHKELVRNNIMLSNDIEYIRMPLGPVPNGFMELSDINEDIVTQIVHSGLSYNSVNYSLKLKRFSKTKIHENEIYQAIKSILNSLQHVSTGILVEKSHEEQSWIDHKNGELYFIQASDLENPLPSQDKGISIALENQKIQASLVKGMLDDIVSESTALEYPSDE